MTLYGKGKKTWRVLLSAETWRCLQRLVAGRDPDAAVFENQRGGTLSRSQIFRIVRTAARRSGIAGAVSAHWPQHAYTSHVLDCGAPARLVRDTLGRGSVAITDSYLHARPDESSSTYLGV